MGTIRIFRVIVVLRFMGCCCRGYRLKLLLMCCMFVCIQQGPEESEPTERRPDSEGAGKHVGAGGGHECRAEGPAGRQRCSLATVER